MTQILRDDVLPPPPPPPPQLASDEVDALQQDLSNIVGYIEQLGELDTTGIEPTYQVTGLSNVWRDDVVDQSGVTREQLLALATEQQNNSVKVPKVL